MEELSRDMVEAVQLSVI